MAPLHHTSGSQWLLLCKNGNILGVRAALASLAWPRNDYLNHTDRDYTTGLMIAVRKGHNTIVKALLEHPSVDLNYANLGGFSALHHAVAADNLEAVQLLLADYRLNTANHQNNLGTTPAMLAMRRNSLDTLRELVAHPSVDLDTKDRWGSGLEEVAR